MDVDGDYPQISKETLLKRDPEILEGLQQVFGEADLAQNGSLSFNEVSDMYSRKLWSPRPNHV